MESYTRDRLSSISFNSMNFIGFSRASSVKLFTFGCRISKPGTGKRSKACQNVLLAITIIQFCIIIAICIVSGLFGNHVCQLLTTNSPSNSSHNNTECWRKGKSNRFVHLENVLQNIHTEIIFMNLYTFNQDCSNDSQCRWFEECKDRRCVIKTNPVTTDISTIKSTQAEESFATESRTMYQGEVTAEGITTTGDHNMIPVTTTISNTKPTQENGSFVVTEDPNMLPKVSQES